MAAISLRIHYGFTASADRSLPDVRLLRITDIQNNSVNWSTVPGCKISAEEVRQYGLKKSDILIARTGGTIGKTFLVAEAPPTAVFASYLIRVQPSAELFDRYLKLFLESPVYWKQLQEAARGTGQPNVNGQTLGRLTISLPPIAEQCRIAAKVDELMKLCDRLAQAQEEREAKRDRLTAASLHRLNNGLEGEELCEHTRFFINHLPRLTTRSDQMKSLRQTILDLAVSGRLVLQDPTDKSASEALRAIQVERGLPDFPLKAAALE